MTTETTRPVTAAEVLPVHDYGDLPMTPGRMAEIRQRDQIAYTPHSPGQNVWTQAEAQKAVTDRHHLLFALTRALTIVEQLAPRVIEKWQDADVLPAGTLLVEANGELSVTYVDHTGGRYFQSPGDRERYRATRLSYPAKVVPLPTGAWIEDDEAELDAIAEAGTE